MKRTGLRAVCGFSMPDGRVCERAAFDRSGKCYHHSPFTAEKRRRYASRGGKSGGNGQRTLRLARKELGEVKFLVRYLAGHTAAGTLHSAMIDNSCVAWNVEKTLDLVKAYLQLCNVELKMGKTHEEDREDEHLDTEEIREGIEAQLTSSSASSDRYDDLHDVLSPRARGEGSVEEQVLKMPAPE